MRWFTSVVVLALSLGAAACAQPAGGPAVSTSGNSGAAAPAASRAASGNAGAASEASAPAAASGSAATVSQAAAPAAGVAVPVSWQRPADVAPLPAEGKFDVIADAPWPGQKVRVFFFGVQG